jgi:outer membrane protein OmpA-like peptidoglycan-associated protein
VQQMQNTTIRIFLLFLLGTNTLAAEKFRWKLDQGEVLEVNKFGIMKVQTGLNTAFQQFKNRIVLKVESAGEKYQLAGKFFTYVRPDLKGFVLLDKKRYWNKGAAFFAESEFFSRFGMESLGQYQVPSRYFMPNLRHIPSFSPESVEVGGTWKARGEEILRLSEKLKIPLRFDVHYKYHGQKTKDVPLADGKETTRPVDIFELEYKVTDKNIVTVPMDKSNLQWNNSWQNGGGQKVPIRLSGTSRAVMYYDRQAGSPLFDRNNYKLDIKYPDGRLVKYRMVIDSFYRRYRPLSPQGRKVLAESIAPKLPQNLKVRPVEDGLRFTLGDILFDFDSDRLRPEGRAVLQKLSGVLKSHPQKNIRIRGYTDSRGRTAYNKGLSLRRARRVAEYMNRLGIGGERLSYQGMGEKDPVADNTTAAGRQANRRVEVDLLTE